MFLAPFWQTSISRKIGGFLAETDLDPRYYVEDEILLTVAINDISTVYDPIVLSPSLERIFELSDDEIYFTGTINEFGFPYSYITLDSSLERIFELSDENVKITSTIIA